MRAPFLFVTALLCALCVTTISFANANRLVAVLDFRATDLELSVGELNLLTEGARKVAVDQLGDTYGIITRENLQDLLRAHGKSLEKCQGACETETGRMLGAEFVVTGHVTRAFGEIHLTMKIHRTDPPTLLATELGKASGPNELPALTQDVGITLLNQAFQKRAATKPRTATQVAPKPPSQKPTRSAAPERPPQRDPASEPHQIGPLGGQYPAPGLGWIAFKGALRDSSIDQQERTKHLSVYEESDRQLQQTNSPDRPFHLKRRILSGFELALLKASQDSSKCWRLERLKRGSAGCNKDVPVEATRILKDIQEYMELQRLTASQLPDPLLFIHAYLTLSKGGSLRHQDHKGLRHRGVRWLEANLVPKDHINALLIVGRQRLLQGDLYTAARVLTRAVHRTRSDQVNGAFARYLLAWVYMAEEELSGGEHRLTDVRDEHRKTAEQRWGGGDGVSMNLFSSLAEDMIQRKRWQQVEKTAPVLLQAIQREQEFREDWQLWAGPDQGEL